MADADEIRVLTVCQPYAELIRRGVKPIENRTWPTSYRGRIAIHAGLSRSWLDDGDLQAYPEMSFGAVVCLATLVACLDLADADRWPARWQGLRDHEHANGPICWVLEDVRPIAPIEVKGRQGLWLPQPWLAAKLQQAERVA